MQPEASVREPPADDVWRRLELRRFLRESRGRLTPNDVGLPSHGYRRVRGLRREEVAELADVSVTWYTCFELGTAHRVSLDFVERIADVLRLEPTEKTYLFALLGAPLTPVSAERHDALQAIVSGAGTTAIAEVDGGLGILAQNDTWHLLFASDPTAPTAHENLLDCIFEDSDLRETVQDWDALAGFACGALRMQLARGHHGAAAAFARYSGDPAFLELWQRATLYDPQDADLRIAINHPDIGYVALRLLGIGLFHAASMLTELSPAALKSRRALQSLLHN